jgi:hypothetical protein
VLSVYIPAVHLDCLVFTVDLTLYDEVRTTWACFWKIYCIQITYMFCAWGTVLSFGSRLRRQGGCLTSWIDFICRPIISPLAAYMFADTIFLPSRTTHFHLWPHQHAGFCTCNLKSFPKVVPRTLRRRGNPSNTHSQYSQRPCMGAQILPLRDPHPNGLEKCAPRPLLKILNTCLYHTVYNDDSLITHGAFVLSVIKLNEYSAREQVALQIRD